MTCKKTECCQDATASCDEETCNEQLCRHEAYINELFSRTEWLKTQLTGTDEELLINFISDAGEAGDNQDLLAAQVVAEDPAILLAGGDNNYETGSHDTIEANWAAFDTFVQRGTAYPALGNHDLDDSAVNPGINQYNKFSYLPNNRRYYHIYNEVGDVDIFVLNSGIDTNGNLVETDGNEIGSTQYNWFISELANSYGRFKIVMFHHPYISGVSNAINNGRAYPELNWGFKSMGIDLILNGHTHTAQHIVTDGLDILDVSSAVRGRRVMSNSGTIYGSDAAISELRWAYAGNGQTGERAYASILVVGRVMSVTVKRTSDGAPIYSFPIIK
jgi:hypothetical protein